MYDERTAQELAEVRQLIDERKYNDFKTKVTDLNAVDIAQLLEEVLSEHEYEELLMFFRLLPKSLAADVFSYFELETEQTIITMLTVKEAAFILDELFADDAADLVDELPANVVTRLLANASPETRADINHLLLYPDYSAGSIMTVEFMQLKATSTVRHALDRIREVALDKETVNNCFVLSERRTLLGTVTLRKLVISNENAVIADIMNDNFVSVSTTTDQEEVAKLFSKYDCTSMPVVDSENRLVGIITVDDIVDIIQDEATEDIEKMAAITPSEKPYLKTSIFHTYLQRVPWLLLLMVSATVTGGIIRSFESALAACVVLTSFVPMLTDTGGNSGSQASVTVIRGLSMGEIQYKDTLKVVAKELGVAALCSITLAAANFVKMLIFDNVEMSITLTVSLTLIVTVIVAKLIGCMLPILAKRIGFDPAVMASPFITTAVDAIALLVYFNIATMILGL